MKKKFLAILLTVCMVLTMAPAALAASSVFTDVTADDWFADEVAYAYDNGLMNGVTGGEFDPEGTVTRAMMWTVLARLDGADTAGSDPWWQAGQQWAMENEISDGTMAENNVEREQMVTMLWRYAKYVGLDVTESTELSYSDASDVSEWAVSAMQWACSAGVINGMDGTLQPQGNATRAQLAAVLYRFAEEVLPEEEPVTPPAPPVIIPSHSHSWGEWVSNDDGTHTRSCDMDRNHTETKDCSYAEGESVCECGYVRNSAAKIGSAYYSTLGEAIEAAGEGDTITLIADIDLGEVTAAQIIVPNSKKITLDLNSHTISAVDAVTSGSFALIENYGDLTITDLSEEGTGKITMSATTNRGWGGQSTIIGNANVGNASVRTTTLTIAGGTIEHTGGSDMNFAINTSNNTGDSELIISGGKVSGTYRTIRMYQQVRDADTCNITVTGGEIVSSTNGAIWLQETSAGDNENTAVSTLTITGGKLVGVGDAVRVTHSGTKEDTVALISGDTFSSDPTAYLASGYIAAEAEGNWTVVAE